MRLVLVRCQLLAGTRATARTFAQRRIRRCSCTRLRGLILGLHIICMLMLGADGMSRCCLAARPEFMAPGSCQPSHARLLGLSLSVAASPAGVPVLCVAASAAVAAAVQPVVAGSAAELWLLMAA